MTRASQFILNDIKCLADRGQQRCRVRVHVVILIAVRGRSGQPEHRRVGDVHTATGLVEALASESG